MTKLVVILYLAWFLDRKPCDKRIAVIISKMSTEVAKIGASQSVDTHSTAPAGKRLQQSSLLIHPLTARLSCPETRPDTKSPPAWSSPKVAD